MTDCNLGNTDSVVFACSNKRSEKKLDKDLKRKINGPGSQRLKVLLLERLRPAELLELMPMVYVGLKVSINSKYKIELKVFSIFKHKQLIYENVFILQKKALYV